MSDPLSDALRELIRAGVDPGLCRRVVGQVRARWVGQCYIRAVDRELRNAEIQAALDWTRGSRWRKWRNGCRPVCIPCGG